MRHDDGGNVVPPVPPVFEVGLDLLDRVGLPTSSRASPRGVSAAAGWYVYSVPSWTIICGNAYNPDDNSAGSIVIY
jgi:hypothetical protein